MRFIESFVGFFVCLEENHHLLLELEGLMQKSSVNIADIFLFKLSFSSFYS